MRPNNSFPDVRGTPDITSAEFVGDDWQFVHDRSISIKCFVDAAKRIRAIGVLQDDKGIPVVSYAGKIVGPGGTVHRMRVVLVVSARLVVEDIGVELIDVPGELCRGIQSAYNSMLGVTIAKGYSRTVRERLGGVAGCTHTTNLLLQMGPAVMQTYYSLSLGPNLYSAQRNALYAELAGSCHVFRSDGPVFHHHANSQGDATD